MRLLPPELTRRLVFFPLCSVVVFTFSAGMLSVSAQNKQDALQTNSDQVLQHLNHVITWYRHTKTQVQPVGLPTDALYQSKANELAVEVAKHAFESAYKIAPLLPTDAQQASPDVQRLMKLRADTVAENAHLVQQISAVNNQIASASKRNRPDFMSQRDRLQGELDLATSRMNALNQLINSIASGQKDAKGQKSGANSFQGSIEQLKSTVPELSDKNKAAPPAITASAAAPAGLIAQLKKLYNQSDSLRQIDTLLLETTQLEKLVAEMRAPLSTALQATVQQGRNLSKNAENAQAGQPLPTKQDFDALAAKLDQLAAVIIPLSEETAALEESKANLTDWSESISVQNRSVLHGIFIRVGVIVGALGLLLLLSDLWKRMSFRYISDVRRRRQFLVLRRFVIGFFMGLIFIFGIVSEFSALATFAGFITAGLAVGLQTILLSVAAYFFLIGRYGLRVGDRISIGGVTGDVVDVGIVRFYMLELTGSGVDLQPTGRVVTFPNSVLFQPGTPMFRQVPGTNYTWHEVAITLNPSGDHQLVEISLMNAVSDVYEQYRSTLERQHSDIERRFEIPFSPLKPRAQLQLSSNGLEAVVRYPVNLHHDVEADQQITRSLIETIGKNEQLQASVSGLPKIRSSIQA